MNEIRSFIAISLSPDIYQQLDQVICSLEKKLPRAPIRWVSARNIHLTLKFLGDVPAKNLDLLRKVLEKEASKHTAFEISVGRFGAFPSLNRPRVLWVGIDAPGQLQAIQNGIDSEMARLGYATENRPFSPHLTLARVSAHALPQEVKQIGQAISGHEVGFLGALQVNLIHFYRSDLQKSGAVYTRLFSVRLQ